MAIFLLGMSKRPPAGGPETRIRNLGQIIKARERLAMPTFMGTVM
jgi:hypothetical protein